MPHRARYLVELLNPVAVTMRELRHIALREGRLLLRDRVQPKRRIGDDPRAVIARDIAVHLRAIGSFNPFAVDTLRGCADLGLRLQRDTLRLEAAMVDACVDIEFGQPFVGKLGPTFPPAFHHLRSVPVSDLLAKTVFVDRAHGQHDMGMGFGHAVFADIPMHIEIGDHAPIQEFGSSEVAGELDAVALTHLARDGEFDLAGKLGVLADFERLDIVPQPFSVAPCLRNVFRQHHLGMDDAALAGKIVAAVKPLVAQP
jgi:hypothetical protein